ncbi:MAG: 16S rRNA (cytidine(1402)-2'-O)-methyltransferase [Candidatus Edwardsbacteria bacterium]|jgi:16S rRNA (cytidine1402-2'-O)-methyltransferase|nr:16S rRNA (cytidine(1402)-2'-O)-methyltransferase [Candidatus Edwardsbacteria bacterium]
MLYLIATPIGNLGDITYRAVETLKAVDLIACEDTRQSLVLLNHYGIRKPLVSFHEHNEDAAGERIVGLLREGRSVAVISDGGTPGISDPGYTVVRRAIAERLPLTMVPGPSAAAMAVVLSGLPVHSFVFRGFPPHKPGARRKFIEQDRDCPYTLVYYESVYRIDKFLADAMAVLGDRPACVCNDLTKLHERVDRGTLSRVAAAVAGGKHKGEFTVVVAGAGHGARATADPEEE